MHWILIAHYALMLVFFAIIPFVLMLVFFVVTPQHRYGLLLTAIVLLQLAISLSWFVLFPFEILPRHWVCAFPGDGWWASAFVVSELAASIAIMMIRMNSQSIADAKS